MDKPKPLYRSLFLSDLHLGLEESRPTLLNRFLKAHKAANLYLVGDIVDTWQLRRSWYWPNAYNTLLRRLIKISRKRRVVFTPGNHDAAFKALAGLHFGRIRILREAVHTTAEGRKLLVCHGDIFDDAMHNKALFVQLGYNMVMRLCGVFNWLRRLFGARSHWSLSNFVAKRVANNKAYIEKFEHLLAEHARHKGVDGVVCGHIHLPGIRRFPDGLTYYNCGDWVDHMTVLAEHWDGRFELIDAADESLWPRSRQQTAGPTASVLDRWQARRFQQRV
ncbi:MAG: UDP-2,3-diacylglucosamine diphosphatase [Phycisphaerae bacterium]